RTVHVRPRCEDVNGPGDTTHTRRGVAMTRRQDRHWSHRAQPAGYSPRRIRAEHDCHGRTRRGPVACPQDMSLYDQPRRAGRKLERGPARKDHGGAAGAPDVEWLRRRHRFARDGSVGEVPGEGEQGRVMKREVVPAWRRRPGDGLDEPTYEG